MRAQVVTIGETMAVFSSMGNTLPHSQVVGLSIAGSESNVAIGLRRLGVHAAWIGKVGADALGDLVLRELAAEHIQVPWIRDQDAPTSIMVKEIRSPTETRIWYYRRGNAGGRLLASDLPTDLIAGADLVHITGISLALSPGMSHAIMSAIETAQRANVKVSFDMNYRSKLWSLEEARTAYLDILPHVDILFASQIEGKIIAGVDGPSEILQALAAHGPSEVILTLGDRGAVATHNNIEYQQPAFPVEVVDTVGAGDAFVAGYLAERMSGETIANSLVTGARLGAYACRSTSDWQSLPTRQELDTQFHDPIQR